MKRYHLKLHLYLLSIFLLSNSLTACSVFGPTPYTNINTYELHACPCLNTSTHKIHKTIYLAPIQTYSGHNTTNMEYTIQPYEISYFSKNRWVAPPAAMLQPLLAAQLQNQFTQVTTTPTNQADFLIYPTLIQFQQRFNSDKKPNCKGYSEFHFAMKIEIINAKTHKTIGLKTFYFIEDTLTANPYGGVLAANKTTQCMLNTISTYIATRT